MLKVREISTDLAQDVFTDALRRRVGPGKKYSVSEVADLTGFKARTIDAWRGGETTPCFPKFLILAALLGKGFLSEAMAPAVAVEANDDHGSASSGLADTLAELTHRLHDDGVFCHKDKAAMGPKLIELGSRMESLGQRWTHGKVPHLGKAS